MLVMTSMLVPHRRVSANHARYPARPGVAWDAGAGYTYFDQKTGHEFSAVGGFTYSLMNPFLQYQNGIDFHVDWAASQFVSKNVQIGLAPATLSAGHGRQRPRREARPLPGREVGIGPQIGLIIPISKEY